MNNTTRRIGRIIHLLQGRGHLAPDHATAAAGRLLEADPLPQGFAFVGAALVRHAAVLDPFDREKLRLAEEVNAPIRHAPFEKWLATASRLTDDEPVPENISMPADPAELVGYLQAQPANSLRLPALLRLARSGDGDAFEAGVQIISASPSGLLAAPIMAWHAHFLGLRLLADMLLDEGVTAFPSHNLLALRAAEAGDLSAAFEHLSDSLNAEPFQPAILTLVAEQKNTLAPSLITRLEEIHATLAHRMSLADMEALNQNLQDDPGDGFLLALHKALPACRPTARVFWQTLAQSLR